MLDEVRLEYLLFFIDLGDNKDEIGGNEDEIFGVVFFFLFSYVL